MATKSGSNSFGWPSDWLTVPRTFVGPALVMTPAIGERGRITVDFSGGGAQWGWNYVDATTYGAKRRGGGPWSGMQVVYDYFRGNDGSVSLVFVSRTGAANNTLINNNGSIHLDISMSFGLYGCPDNYWDGAGSASSPGVSTPYSNDGSGYIQGTVSGSFSDSWAVSYSADYTRFLPAWAANSNRGQ